VDSKIIATPRPRAPTQSPQKSSASTGKHRRVHVQKEVSFSLEKNAPGRCAVRLDSGFWLDWKITEVSRTTVVARSRPESPLQAPALQSPSPDTGRRQRLRRNAVPVLIQLAATTSEYPSQSANRPEFRRIKRDYALGTAASYHSPRPPNFSAMGNGLRSDVHGSPTVRPGAQSVRKGAS